MTRLLGALAALFLFLPGVALAQSAAVMNAPVTVGECSGWSDADGTLISSGVGCANHQVTIRDGAHGSMQLTPTILGLPNSAGILNTTAGQPVILAHTIRTGTDAGDFQCYRDANYTGGTAGFVNPCFYSYTVSRAGTTSYEWSFLARNDNYGTAADLSQNVAAYFQGRKLSSGSTWGAVTELYDTIANPTTSSVTDEHDMTATGTDNNNGRVLFDGWLRNVSGTAAVEAAYGIRLNTGAGGFWKHGIYLNGAYGDGLNLSNGTYLSAPIIIADGQKICTTALCANSLFHSAGVTYLNSPGGNLVSFSDAGGISGTSLGSSGPIYLSAGQKLCVDGATCAYYWSQTGGTTSYTTPTGATVTLTSGGSLSNFGDLSSFAGNIFLSATKKFCLDGSTCANYLTQSGGTITIGATGGGGGTSTISGTGATLGATSVLSLASGGAVSGTTGTFSAAVSGTTITGSSTVQGATVTSTSNVIVPTNGKLCLNGATCTAYITYDGTYVKIFNGGVQGFAEDNAGAVYSAAPYRIITTAGVTCSGAPTAAFASSGGIVTHC